MSEPESYSLQPAPDATMTIPNLERLERVRAWYVDHADEPGQVYEGAYRDSAAAFEILIHLAKIHA